MRIALTALALSLAAIPAANLPAAAQTSFGKVRPAPTNLREYEKTVEDQLMIGIRRANSSLPRSGRATRIATLVAVAIRPDGRLGDVQILQSNGGPGLDEALVRAIAASAPFPAFTPDMAGKEMYIHTLGLGVHRN
ncbi:TonB C-terminal domain-containing protein (plasmid) [Paracoccus sp. TK19116]|uniref:TonB C-terminal domain-containing protein n=1 Tax=Paracoccus albicereus TaxID=2922394 RepID=A0ABT1MLD0_9RHOB|nr:TonB family protein [Paracoccus albicereus]MCQ0968904.1 TonB C-terminal domain-containing protein [Paracoccus albicereus]